MQICQGSVGNGLKVKTRVPHWHCSTHPFGKIFVVQGAL
jgi:hypothetical protein